MTRPRSNGDPPSGQPTHCARDTRTGRAPGWWVGGHTTTGGAQVLGGHQEGAESDNPPYCTWYPCRDWHRVAQGACCPFMISPSPFAQQSVLFKKYMKIQRKEFITNFPHCDNLPCPPRCQPPTEVSPVPWCQVPQVGGMWRGISWGLQGMSGTPLPRGEAQVGEPRDGFWGDEGPLGAGGTWGISYC